MALDDRKGNPRRRSLPSYLWSKVVGPFLCIDAPLPNQLYAIGGRNHLQDPQAAVEMFDTWHGQWISCPSMLGRRAGCSAVALPDGRLMVVGGYDERGITAGLLASCEFFDPMEQTWASADADLLRARWGHSCTCLGGLVYCIGGCTLRAGVAPQEAFMETLRSCELYDPMVGKWTMVASLCVARAGVRAVTLGSSHIAAVGGCDDVFGRAEILTSVELFDIRTGQWALLGSELRIPRTTAAVAAIDDEHILVVGGAPSLSSAEIYCARPHRLDEATRRGRRLAGADSKGPLLSDMPEGRMGCQAVAIDLPTVDKQYPMCTSRCIVVAGGENGDDESGMPVRQFSSSPVFDLTTQSWRANDYIPPLPTCRTALALCVGPGKVCGHPC